MDEVEKLLIGSMALIMIIGACGIWFYKSTDKE